MRIDKLAKLVVVLTVTVPRMGTCACCTHTQTLLGTQPREQFGDAVAIWDDGALPATMAVGSQEWIHPLGVRSGAVSVYRLGEDQWEVEQQLVPSDPQQNGEFSVPTFLSRDVLAVSAPQVDEFQGAAYVFRYREGDGWTEEAKLSVDGANQLGLATARLGSDRLAVSSVGAVHFFRYAGQGRWELEDASIRTGAERLGVSLAATGNILVVGDDQNPILGTGAVHVFEDVEGRWTLRSTLTPSDGVAGDLFGYAVSASPGTVYVGAYQQNSDRPGAAYVFEPEVRGDWTTLRQVATLKASDGVNGDQFGVNVFCEGDRLLVGAPFHARETGAVYLFVRPPGGWKDAAEDCKLTGPAVGGRFGDGRSAALSQSLLAVSSDRADAVAGEVDVYSCVTGPDSAWVRWDTGPGANGHWYKLTELSGTWEDAEAEAIKSGGHLAAINSDLENEWLLTTLALDTVWIGLYQAPGSSEPGGGWSWSTGEPTTFTNWLASEPNNDQGEESWAEMKGRTANQPRGGWNDQGPTHRIRGVIERVTLPPMALAWTRWDRGPGATGHWYKLTEVPGQWDEAEAEAIENGGHLAAINSSLENDWVLAHLALDSVWIGLYQPPESLERGGGWSWATGEPMTFTNWLDGEPNNHLGEESWAEMKGRMASLPPGGWNDQGPSHLLRGVIERDTEPSDIRLSVFVAADRCVYFAGSSHSDTTIQGDIVGSHAPPFVDVSGTSAVSVVAAGCVRTDPPAACWPPAGDPASPETPSPVFGYDRFGISTLTSFNAGLVGVFLTDAPPDPSTVPFPLDVQPPALPVVSNPQIQQSFFIGTGPVRFQVPRGATRLFLGVHEAGPWTGNHDGFDVLVKLERGPMLPRTSYVTASVKVVRDRTGERPKYGHYATDEQIKEAIEQANAVLQNSGVSWRVFLSEIVEVTVDPRFQRLAADQDEKLELEATAKQQSEEYAWRTDAINFYVLPDIVGAGGICSFPATDQIIVISNSRGILNGGTGWLHEIGHYLSLTHTFENGLESDPDTCTGRGSRHKVGPITPCLDVCPDDFNVMSYNRYQPSQGVFSDCQVREMAFELFDPAGSRGAVLRSQLPPEARAPTADPERRSFLRGDGNGDGALNIADAVKILGFLFQKEQAVPCLDAVDANDDGAVDVSDAIAVLLVLFAGRDLPAPGASACGIDVTLDDLGDCNYSSLECPHGVEPD